MPPIRRITDCKNVRCPCSGPPPHCCPPGCPEAGRPDNAAQGASPALCHARSITTVQILFESCCPAPALLVSRDLGPLNQLLPLDPLSPRFGPLGLILCFCWIVLRFNCIMLQNPGLHRFRIHHAWELVACSLVWAHLSYSHPTLLRRWSPRPSMRPTPSSLAPTSPPWPWAASSSCPTSGTSWPAPACPSRTACRTWPPVTSGPRRPLSSSRPTTPPVSRATLPAGGYLVAPSLTGRIVPLLSGFTAVDVFAWGALGHAAGFVALVLSQN